MQKIEVDRRLIASRQYVPGEYLVVRRPSRQVIRLRNTGALLWHLLMEGMQIPEIVSYIHSHFDVDEDRAASDAATFVQDLHRRGFLVIDGEPQVEVPVLPKLDIAPDFLSQVMTQRIPYSGIIELTRTCHLRCVHCYHPIHSDDSRLSTDEWRRILAELAEAGTCMLTFTGGEVFLRPDAIELIEEATDRGFIVNVLTTGTVVKPETIASLARLHLATVSLSLYGAHAQTHEAITRLPGSFEQVIAVASELRDAGIRVSLSFMVSKQNFMERIEVQDLAARLGIPVDIDFKLFPRHNGDPSPLNLRLDADEVLELIREGLVDYPEGQGTCTAGMGKFSITPEGNVKVCQVFPYALGNLKAGSFREIWTGPAMEGLAKRFQEILPDECRYCPHKSACYRCPAMSLLEHGHIDSRHLYYCSLTKAVINDEIPRHTVQRAVQR